MPPSTQGDGGTGSSSYQSAARGLIERHKEYPPFARKAGLEGTCVVRFVLRRDGALDSVTVARSSGRRILDDAACSAVRRVGRFPALPEALAGDKVTVEVPLVFRLGGG